MKPQKGFLHKIPPSGLYGRDRNNIRPRETGGHQGIRLLDTTGLVVHLWTHIWYMYGSMYKPAQVCPRRSPRAERRSGHTPPSLTQKHSPIDSHLQWKLRFFQGSLTLETNHKGKSNAHGKWPTGLCMCVDADRPMRMSRCQQAMRMSRCQQGHAHE